MNIKLLLHSPQFDRDEIKLLQLAHLCNIQIVLYGPF